MKLRNKKTGEIREVNYIEIDGMFTVPSLATLYENWEDYRPAEPLIKDEKIREAMKVWAKVNDVKEVMFDGYWHSFRDVDMVISFLFTFKDFDCLKDGKQYTIAELCGEEEEPRPVIANGVKYDSYADYLKSREEEEWNIKSKPGSITRSLMSLKRTRSKKPESGGGRTGKRQKTLVTLSANGMLTGSNKL